MLLGIRSGPEPMTNDAGRAIQQTADSGFIVAGYTRYLINAYNIYLIKTDSIGDTLWTKQYVDTVTGGANSIQQTLDGGYIIAGVRLGEMYIIKTNAWGDTLWTRTFGDSQNLSQAFNVRQTQDGGYIISGTGTIGSAFGAYIIKTDSLGIVSSGTGIAEVNNPLLFDVYPNPASEILNVKIKGVSGRNASLTIYNMNGQLVYATGVKNNATVQIDLSVLPYGMYAVSLRSNNRIFIRKILHHQ
jgi:Secretion system C-terminal sorting domain